MGRAPPPAFHTLAVDMPLNRGATHFTLGLRSCIFSSYLLQIYLPPHSKLPSCAPDGLCRLELHIYSEEFVVCLIHGSGVVRAGQWARKLIINNDLGRYLPVVYTFLKGTD